ncbi:di-heme oxidoredictase family protein [Pseudorhodobacter sp.]|uniref:di-heme oxidoreductase family protein n=1 Tax=Pseudorhodobacter sp. TaxID=1934400 RepID=UPI00264858C4|nr:di-heme oxidoredictase family protein [Pseudorhodobacter sp.]MDN5788625.1 c-type cytochrome [Pseudorhodobacter sp.]
MASGSTTIFAQDLHDLQLPLLPRSAEEAARIAKVTAPTQDFSEPEKFEQKPAGAATVRARDTADAFSDPSANIGLEGRMTFNLGNGLFTKPWVSSPSSTTASDGLGPIFNARACQLCHLKDGRGTPPNNPDEAAVSLFLRLSLPADHTAEAEAIEGWLSTQNDPVYGGQLQNFSLPGIPAEGQMTISYTDRPMTLAGGEVVTLRAPKYGISNPGYGPINPALMMSPRIAPQMIGLGLLEAIPAADILAGADPDDADGDGISGRPNIVMSAEFGVPMLGRFGHKAGMPTIREQSAGAFSGDMGLSTPLHPSGAGDCTTPQTACMAAPDGADPKDGLEVSADSLELVTFYSRNLGVPERRDMADAEVLHGKELFYSTGCIACHTPKFVTGRMDGDVAQSFQLIWPYTDLLLHDMGDGLADNRPEGRADGREWRTAPLWGIGLTGLVSGHTNYLHDGRARSLMEAILWHGGEAQAARDTVTNLPKSDRDALIRYLESL